MLYGTGHSDSPSGEAITRPRWLWPIISLGSPGGFGLKNADLWNAALPVLREYSTSDDFHPTPAGVAVADGPLDRMSPRVRIDSAVLLMVRS